MFAPLARIIPFASTSASTGTSASGAGTSTSTSGTSAGTSTTPSSTCSGGATQTGCVYRSRSFTIPSSIPLSTIRKSSSGTVVPNDVPFNAFLTVS